MLIPLLLMAADAQPVPRMFARLPNCESATAPITEPCVLPVVIDPATAKARLGEKGDVWWIDGDRLTMIARPTRERWVMLCCSIQTGLDPIAHSALATITVRVPKLREAILDIRSFPADDDTPHVVRGPDAVPAPAQQTPPPDRLKRVAIRAHWLSTERGLTVYMPPPGTEPHPLPVFYLADDLAAKFAPILEAAIQAGRSPAAILVGIDAAEPSTKGCVNPACDQRGAEYKLDFSGGDASPASPFGKHLQFLVDQVIPYVEAHYPASKRREDRIIGGSSNGGDWALTVAALRPDLFGNVMALSSSGRLTTTLATALAQTRLYGGAGLYEPTYRRNTLDAVAAAQAAGAETRVQTIASGHSQAAWDVMFADAAPWLLIRTPEPPR